MQGWPLRSKDQHTKGSCCHGNKDVHPVPSLPAALSLPIRPGEGRGWAFLQRRPGLVSGGAQEPRLLRLREASHQDHHQQIQGCLVNLLLLIIVRYCSVTVPLVTSDLHVPGTPEESRQRPRQQETRKLTWWSCDASWTLPLTWTRSKTSSKPATCSTWTPPTLTPTHSLHYWRQHRN